jgi:small-conductance mechanosensitive channel
MTRKRFIFTLIVYWLVAIGIWFFASLLWFDTCFSCPSATFFLLPEIIGTVIILLIFAYLTKFQYEKYKDNVKEALKAKRILLFIVYGVLALLIILSLVGKVFN